MTLNNFECNHPMPLHLKVEFYYLRNE